MNPMSAISEKLHHARVERGVSLEDIASATRINLKFLQEIDGGRMPDVGPTYVRAFVKAFAAQVGLDGDELLKEEIKAPETVKASSSPEISEPSKTETPRRIDTATSDSSTPPSPQRQVKTLLVISALILCGLAMMMFWLHSQRSDLSVKENAFPDLPKEAKLSAGEIPKDSLVAAAPPVKTIPRPDSLALEAVASESVWVHIVIDGSLTKEYVFTPAFRMHWKAKKTFLLSVGNAAGISLTLNGKRLGPMGKSKKPAKNVPVSWETYDQLQKETVKKEKG